MAKSREDYGCSFMIISVNDQLKTRIRAKNCEGENHMSLSQIGKAGSKGTILLVLGLVLLAACGSNTGASAGASATATACAKTVQSANSLRAIIGTLKSINNKTLVLTTTQEKSTTVTYSSTTTFTQEARLTASALKEGAPVSVVVQSTGSTYTAVSVTTGSGMKSFTNGGPGPGGIPAKQGTPVIISGGPGSSSNSNGAPATTINNGPCSAPKSSAKNTSSGTPGATSHALLGTVSQVNGAILTITDPTGASYTVTLTAQTQIIGTRSASAAALKVGEPLTVTGKGSNQNSIAANTIEILLSLPDRPSAPMA